jgi:hypothetical protein
MDGSRTPTQSNFILLQGVIQWDAIIDVFEVCQTTSNWTLRFREGFVSALQTNVRERP